MLGIGLDRVHDELMLQLTLVGDDQTDGLTGCKRKLFGLENHGAIFGFPHGNFDDLHLSLGGRGACGIVMAAVVGSCRQRKGGEERNRADQYQ